MGIGTVTVTFKQMTATCELCGRTHAVEPVVDEMDGDAFEKLAPAWYAIVGPGDRNTIPPRSVTNGCGHRMRFLTVNAISPIDGKFRPQYTGMHIIICEECAISTCETVVVLSMTQRDEVLKQQKRVANPQNANAPEGDE